MNYTNKHLKEYSIKLEALFNIFNIEWPFLIGKKTCYGKPSASMIEKALVEGVCIILKTNKPYTVLPNISMELCGPEGNLKVLIKFILEEGKVLDLPL